MDTQTSGTRPLRWTGEAALTRCAAQIATACTAWAQAWTGRTLSVEVRAGSAPGWPQRSLALASGERVALGGVDLAALFENHPTDGFSATPEGPSIRHAVGSAAETDLLERVFAAVVGTAAGGEVPVPDRPSSEVDLPYAGTASFEARWSEQARVHVQVSGAALAHLAPRPARTLKPQPLEAAAVRRLAAQSRVQGCLRLADLHLPLGALMQAEVGDVIVLDRRLDAPFEWAVDAVGLCLPAQLVRSGDSLALELL
ncbi:MAG TPA: FliM/FliN family flagellar motor C-terminal domain-containing protein [Burkholderiaceae bacterium]|nr:FliM/FliN family flagellar motor C-terminal domain-containing protein [Burkholderiaceae bacterium]